MARTRRRVVLSVNQDAGIDPGRPKGAAVHLNAMRVAFANWGVECVAVDEADDQRLVDVLDTTRERLGADLIYERYALGKSAAARYAARHDIPFVLEVNAPLADEQRRWRGGSVNDDDAREDAFAMAQADKIIAVSTDVARYAVARGGDARRIGVFPNGIDTGSFNLSARAHSVRGQLFPADRFVIGFHGRLRPWHGFGMLVDAVLGLIENGVAVHLLTVGEGDFKDLERLPDSCFDRIEWQPHSSIPPYVAACDVLPLTYGAELPCYFSPLKLMEAMACGVVPLVPDLGDLGQVVGHLDTGMVYRAGDRLQLQQYLERLAEDGDLRRALGRRAAREAAGHSWDRIAAEVLSVVGHGTGEAAGAA